MAMPALPFGNLLEQACEGSFLVLLTSSAYNLLLLLSSLI